MPRAARGRTTRSTRSPATFTLDGHLIETYNHIDDLPHLSSLPKKRPRHATRGATAAERRADRQAPATAEPIPNGMVTRSSRQNLLRPSNSVSPLTAPSPSSEPSESDHPPISCRVCLRSNTPTKIICCSICRKGVHTFCLNPPVMDLPNDASWKCVKCRRTHLPLKKEARIILRDALNSYSSLCTDRYVNAVANVVCVVSDSESADHKKNGKTSLKPNPQLEPSHHPSTPNDNTVILRVSTDDSDLDSDVDDDIQPNPIANSRKPQLTNRSPERTDTNDDRAPPTNPAPRPHSSNPPRKEVTKEDLTPSYNSSLDIDDERPLSELMSHGAQRRHRHAKVLKSKDVDPAHASPKMRLKAKQRRMREDNPDPLSPSPSVPKPPRDPRNVPPKRRGRKSHSRKVESDTNDNGKPLDVDCEDDSAGQKRSEAGPVGNNSQGADSRITPTSARDRFEIKRESSEQVIEVSGPQERGSHTDNMRAKDKEANLSDGSASKIGEEYPADTEDDLPLSKRSARYRKLSMPGSSKESKDKCALDNGGEQESKESPQGGHDQVSKEGNHSKELKIEAVVQDTSGGFGNKPAEASAAALESGDDLRPSTSHPNLKPNTATARTSSDQWAQIKLDPKREALFALARVQRQSSKPGDSSGRLGTSLEGEASGRFSRLMSRTNNVPETERQRIQVTALAASNMRRNVSNMASTMAGLRPHSPRMSKGSINSLLQQNQTEVRGGMAPQRSYAELAAQDVAIPGHETHRDRDSLQPHASRMQLSEGDGGKFSPGMYSISANPRRQEGNGTSVRQYDSLAPSGPAGVYSVRQHQNVPRSGMLNSMEPEAQPFAKQSRGADLPPHAKRQRTNKSDLHNMLSNDNMISADESRNIQRGDPTAKVYPEVDRQILEPSSVRHGVVHGHSSNGPAQAAQTIPPFPFPQRLSHSHFESSRVPTSMPGSGSVAADRLSVPQGTMGSIDDRNLRIKHASGGYTYQGFSYGNSSTPGESRGHLSREEGDFRSDQRPQDTNSIRRGDGSDFRGTPQLYSSAKPAGESFSPGLRWNDNRNLGATALRRDYGSPSTANQPWSESRQDQRSPARETSYDAPVNRFIPIDRRTRRPMPYVPTATRKAQFEQGRALAFIDSRPAPPNAPEPSDVYQLDDGVSRVVPRSYSARQEGTYSGSNDYSYPAGDRSRKPYPNLDGSAPANSLPSNYYAHRRDYMGGRGPTEHRVDDRGPFLSESRGDPLQRERIGSGATGAVGNVFEQPRSSIHRAARHSLGGTLEPPIDARKGLAIERIETPSLGPLGDTQVRLHQAKDLARMTNALEPDRRLAEKRMRLTTGPGQDDMAYTSSRVGGSSRRSQDFADASYGPYHAGKNQNKAIRPPESVIGTRIPTPLHADPGRYRSRDTLSAQAGRNFAPNIVGTSGSRGIFDRRDNQLGNSYSYARRDAEARSSGAGQRGTSLEESNEELGADRVSNIPLVARFDNSLTGYGDGNAAARPSDGGARAGERSMGQRNEQREQIPLLRSNPSLRDLLS